MPNRQMTHRELPSPDMSASGKCETPEHSALFLAEAVRLGGMIKDVIIRESSPSENGRWLSWNSIEKAECKLALRQKSSIDRLSM
jgi:hypothetical protein